MAFQEKSAVIQKVGRCSIRRELTGELLELGEALHVIGNELVIDESIFDEA